MQSWLGAGVILAAVLLAPPVGASHLPADGEVWLNAGPLEECVITIVPSIPPGVAIGGCLSTARAYVMSYVPLP